MSEAPLQLGEQRLADVRRERWAKGVGGFLSASAVAQLLFAAFAFGHSRGPLPMRPLELLGGMGAALVFSIAYSLLTWRRRMENGARYVVTLVEGQHRRRLAVFRDYLTLDRETVLLARIESVESSEGQLLIRYPDPETGGPVLRVLVADEPVRNAIRDRIKPP